MSKFSELLQQMQEIHDKKSHDYAPQDDPYGNYKFAGKLGQLFDNSDDAGFIARVAEKLFRLANIDNNALEVKNESIEDTELDIITIVALWIAMRRDRRTEKRITYLNKILNDKTYDCIICNKFLETKDLYIKHAIDMHAACYEASKSSLHFTGQSEVI